MKYQDANIIFWISLFCAVFQHSDAGEPKTERQKKWFAEVTKQFKAVIPAFLTMKGEGWFDTYFAAWTTLYCEDLEEAKLTRYGRNTDFMMEMHQYYFGLFKDGDPDKYDGDEKEVQFNKYFRKTMEGYCEDDKANGVQGSTPDVPPSGAGRGPTNTGASSSQIGYPETDLQKQIFKSVLESFQKVNPSYANANGATTLMRVFLPSMTDYCTDLNNNPAGPLTDNQLKWLAKLYRVFKQTEPDKYEGEEGQKKFISSWSETFSKYCAESTPIPPVNTPPANNPAPPATDPIKNIIDQPLVITMHYIIKQKATGDSDKTYKDYFSIKVLDSGSITVKDLSVSIKEERDRKAEMVKREGFEVFPDPWQSVNQIYMEGKEKPIFAGTKPKTGGEVEFRVWTQSAVHVHVYNYKPTDTRIPVVKTPGRQMYIIYPVKQADSKMVLGANNIHYYQEELSVSNLVRNGFIQLTRKYGWKEYDNNIRMNVVYYQNGDVFYEKEDPPAKIKDQLAKGKYKDADPLLFYTFNPLDKLPY